jgi:hypothetical protein
MKFPCSVQCFIPPILGQIFPIHALYHFLFPKLHLYPCTHRTCYMALQFYPLYSTNQYNSVSSTNHEPTLYITLSTLLFPPLPYVQLFPDPHTTIRIVLGKLNFKLWVRKRHFVFLLEWLICIRYINVAVFMIWSLTFHNSRHINIEKYTTGFNGFTDI